MPTIPLSLIKGPDFPPKIEWEEYSDLPALAEAIQGHVQTTSSSHIGIAIHLSKDASLELVALAVSDKSFIHRSKTADKKKKATRKSHMVTAEAMSQIFSGVLGQLSGFGMHRIATHIHHHYNCLFKAVELSHPDFSPGRAVHDSLCPSTSSFDVDQLWDFSHDNLDTGKAVEYLVQRAWISAKLATNQQWQNRISPIELISTANLVQSELFLVHRLIAEVDRIDHQKPVSRVSEFSAARRSKDGSMKVRNERFPTRIRNDKKVRVELTDSNGKSHLGTTAGAQGKTTTVKTLQKVEGRIKTIRIVGREKATFSESARDAFVLSLLRGKAALEDPDYPFVKLVFFPDEKKSNRSAKQVARTLPSGLQGRTLNQSQADVVVAITTDDLPVVVAHGPPGTGKTTTISVAVRDLVLSRKTVYVVAQSNVGVKNIAEKMCKHGVDFILLVSKEFYLEWHEHIYEEVKDNLVRLDELPQTPKNIEELFHGKSVVLCTLSTLSNPTMTEKRVFDEVPVHTLIIDEASQIGILDYLHLFGTLKNLRKVCFFGDPKQLPPFGKSHAPTLQSIFEVKQFARLAYFLDTQYRMPMLLGNFISTNVYDGKLKSIHPIDHSRCVKFVDVWNGEEEQSGTSQKNYQEALTVRRLVSHYKSRCCVITPYDAQRNKIQELLKSANLPWENVFNIDSFQGNEADIIIVSVVRTKGSGFLHAKARLNVMLTRCKKGLIIVGKRTFLRRADLKTSLLGKLATHWEGLDSQGCWMRWQDIELKKDLLPA